MSNNYAASFPLALPDSAPWHERVVTEGHAAYCAEHGHATHTIDGVIQAYCPRCGDNLPRRPILTGRETVRVGRVYLTRYAHDSELSRAEYKARLVAIAAELYPNKRYPGANN